jgi:hypothetical protein
MFFSFDVLELEDKPLEANHAQSAGSEAAKNADERTYSFYLWNQF